MTPPPLEIFPKIQCDPDLLPTYVWFSPVCAVMPKTQWVQISPKFAA